MQPLKWPNNVFEMMTMYRSLRWGSRRIVIRASTAEGLEMWQAERRERQRYELQERFNFRYRVQRERRNRRH